MTIKNLINDFTDLSHTQLIAEEHIDILNIKFPIKNDEFHYLFIDANLGIKDNLFNIFFIEFDLNAIKDNIKAIKDINNDNVDKEYYFSLNANFHGVKFFKNDLKFSIENRELIKCIQFKLESYKNEIIQNKKNDNITLRNDFFGKILCNTNFGIEFHKPSL